MHLVIVIYSSVHTISLFTPYSSLSPSFSYILEVTIQVTEKVEEEEKPKKLKITKKKKSKVEIEPEKKPEPFTVSLKKVKKKPLQQATICEEKLPWEEVTEYFPDFPTEVIEFIDIEPSMEEADLSTEGVWMCHSH